MESTTAGVTWLELFALYDTSGQRSKKSEHVKDEKAKKRLEERMKLKESVRPEEDGGKKKRQHSTGAISNPTLREELKRFKDLVKQISKHEADSTKQKWFQMEQRQRLRRLADLGVEGRQPAIAAYVRMSKQEKERVARSIVSQKVGANPKSLRSYEEHLERSKEGSQEDDRQTIKIKKAKIAFRNVVKWKRKEDGEDEDEDNKEEGLSEGRITYTSRRLRCVRCMTEIETKAMQLHTKDGFRGIHCPGCKRQDRCLYNLCQCDVIWHQ